MDIYQIERKRNLGRHETKNYWQIRVVGSVGQSYGLFDYLLLFNGLVIGYNVDPFHVSILKQAFFPPTTPLYTVSLVLWFVLLLLLLLLLLPCASRYSARVVIIAVVVETAAATVVGSVRSCYRCVRLAWHTTIRGRTVVVPHRDDRSCRASSKRRRRPTSSHPRTIPSQSMAPSHPHCQGKPTTVPAKQGIEVKIVPPPEKHGCEPNTVNNQTRIRRKSWGCWETVLERTVQWLVVFGSSLCVVGAQRRRQRRLGRRTNLDR